MLVDAPLMSDLASAPELARSLEEAGYAGAWTAEIKNDPFLPLLRGAERTTRLELGTGIAVAFARNPMLVILLHKPAGYFRRYFWHHFRQGIVRSSLISIKSMKLCVAWTTWRGFASGVIWGVKRKLLTWRHLF